MAPSSISAAVLIGGRSRRMGVPKALIRLNADGDTLIERTVATLDLVAGDTMLVGVPSWPMPPSLADRRVVPDAGVSAADGVVAALEAAASRFVIIVACDMPFLDAGLLREMADQANRVGRGCIATDADGVHPLHAVWYRDRLPELLDALARGERSLGRLARRAGMIELNLAGRTDRECWSVVNVNTPEELARARAREIGDR